MSQPPRVTTYKAELLEDRHAFELTEAQVADVFPSSLYREVIASAAFQRLKKIHFLGSLDYVVDPEGSKPNKRHTRYQHSLGVARLALQFARDRALSKRDEQICVVAALLHDIGHAPLSHSLESVFKDQFGLSHHIVSERIIKGDAPIGSGLFQTLRRWDINPFEVLSIVNGKGAGIHRELFNYAANVDTIEAIIRSSTYIFPTQMTRPPSAVLKALLTRDEESTQVLDAFWRLKDDVYSKLIQHRTGVLADYICQDYMRRAISEFEQQNYYFTEADLEARHPGLFESLHQISSRNARELLPGTDHINFVRRRFVIDESVPLSSIYSVDMRYTQTRREDCYQL